MLFPTIAEEGVNTPALDTPTPDQVPPVGVTVSVIADAFVQTGVTDVIVGCTAEFIVTAIVLCEGHKLAVGTELVL